MLIMLHGKISSFEPKIHTERTLIIASYISFSAAKRVNQRIYEHEYPKHRFSWRIIWCRMYPLWSRFLGPTLLTNSQEHSFPATLCKFESNTTCDWLNQVVSMSDASKFSKICWTRLRMFLRMTCKYEPCFFRQQYSMSYSTWIMITIA